MEVSRPSELLRLNLEGLCLHATALRVMPSSVIDEASWTARDFLGRALNAPRETAVEHAVRSLIAMGALYSDDELATPLGAALAHLPLDPRPALAACYGRLLCGARSADAFRAVCCMDGKDPFVCVQCLDAVDATRLQERWTWVVSFPILTEIRRAGLQGRQGRLRAEPKSKGARRRI